MYSYIPCIIVEKHFGIGIVPVRSRGRSLVKINTNKFLCVFCNVAILVTRHHR
jgi:hypothetical protein